MGAVQALLPQPQNETLQPSPNGGTPVQDLQHNAASSVVREHSLAENLTQLPETGNTGVCTVRLSRTCGLVIIDDRRYAFEQHESASERPENKVYRVQTEPERVGWARISDLVRQRDKAKIEDLKEDIDTLLVFVSVHQAPQLFILLIHEVSRVNRPVYSRR